MIACLLYGTVYVCGMRARGAQPLCQLEGTGAKKPNQSLCKLGAIWAHRDEEGAVLSYSYAPRNMVIFIHGGNNGAVVVVVCRCRELDMSDTGSHRVLIKLLLPGGCVIDCIDYELIIPSMR